jgi:hypothetical protein
MFSLTFYNLKNPDEIKDLGEFKIEVFKSYDEASGQLQLPIVVVESHVLPASDLREKVEATVRIDTTLEEF